MILFGKQIEKKVKMIFGKNRNKKKMTGFHEVVPPMVSTAEAEATKRK